MFINNRYIFNEISNKLIYWASYREAVTLVNMNKFGTMSRDVTVSIYRILSLV